MSRIPRVPTALISIAALLAASIAVVTVTRGAEAADQDPPIIHSLSYPPSQSPSYRSTLSSDGRYAVFEAAAGETPSLWFRDIQGPTDTVRLPGLDDLSAVTPSMSGDAGLVAFAGGRFGSTTPGPIYEGQLYALNRRNPDSTKLTQVTGNANDLPYQRIDACQTEGGYTVCPPKLSRDGTTLVAPIRQSIESSDLELTINGQPAKSDGKLYPVLDFWAFDTSAEGTVTIKNTSQRPIVYPDTGPVIEGDSQFTIASSNCAGALQPNASCTVTVKYTGSADCTLEANGVLRFASVAAAGQTAVGLTAGGECPRLAAFPPRAAAATPDCSGPSQYDGLSGGLHPQPADAVHPHPWVALGEVQSGRLGMTSFPITNTSSLPLVPRLTSQGCQMKLVDPPAAGTACKPGQPIAPQASCQAYLEYNFPEVAPVAAGLHIGDTVYRIGGHASRKVVAAWQDAGASGNFGPGKVVSVTAANGTVMDGADPAVSATGRWIAFVSRDPLGRPADSVPRDSNQIYLYDAESGASTLVSFNTQSRLEYAATEPSVSDDGTRIAFRAASHNDIPDQVWARDLTAKKSVLVSTDANGQTGDAESSDPVLSGDGYTVAYLSSADDLGLGTLPGNRVIARDLTKDLAGGSGVNELISPRTDGPGTAANDQYIALSQDGTLATFASRDRVDIYTDADEESDVFWSQRRGSMSGTPDPVDFGTAKVGTTAGPAPYTVTNTGNTVLRLSKPDLNEEFASASDQCIGTPIRPGQTCDLLLKFTPRAVGLRETSTYLDADGGAVVPSIRIRVTGRGSSDVRMPGETRHVSTNSSEHLDPAISDSGQIVAYRSRTATGDTGYTQINVRDQTQASVRTFGEHARVGPPTISGDGSRVAYNAGQVTAEQTFVATAAKQQQVSGTTTDLRYQRPCYDALGRDCRPDISGDGKTVALAAQLDPLAGGGISLQVKEPNGSLHEVRGLIDVASGGTRTLQVTSQQAIHFAEKASVDKDSGFWISGTTCAGDLAAGGTCTVDVNWNACRGAGYGVLRLNGSTPAGQAALALVANGTCISIRSAPAAKAAAACTPMPAPQNGFPYGETTNAGNTVANAGRVAVGTVKYLTAAVPPTSSVQDLDFESGCDFALMTPTNPSPELPKPCVSGERLPANTGCTAYVAYRPSSPDAAAATLNVIGTSVKPVRFSGTGLQSVVLTRTDVAGDGTFSGAPEVVNKDADGNIVAGYQPSLSADGRYVAFAGVYGEQDPNGFELSLQVYRRDRTAGTTAIVSQLADGKVGTDSAEYPSLSASGDRVAFYVDGVSQPGLKSSRAEAADDAPLPAPHPSAIWARDISGAQSVLVSAAAGKPTENGNGWSSEPSISDDGTTVGFSSNADDLVEQPGNDQRAVFVRYLDPDFAGADTTERFSERVSVNENGAVTEDGQSSTPSLSADGAFTAFDSTYDLVANTADDGLSDIFVRRRTAQLVATPASADFGAVQVGKSSSAHEMVVKNVGYGPAAAGPADVPAPFVAGDNVCRQTLHRGQTCTVDARFAPTVAGPASGTLTLPSKQGYLDGPSVAVGLSGTGTPLPPGARFTVTPTALTFPAVEVGKASSPRSAKLQNTGDVPLNVTATVNGAGDFSVNLGTCTTVMPGVACDVPVTFAPRATGTRTGSVVFTPTSTNPEVKSPAAVTVGLNGSGTPGAAVASMTVTPTALAFKPQILTVPSAPQSITVKNTGTVPLTLSATSSVADFRPAVTCAPLAPGKTCVIAVRFAPQLLGVRAGVVQVSAAATGAVAPFPVPVKVTGTTLTPTLIVEPPVARPGQIVVATGTNFPPGRAAVLGWDVGLGGQQALPDKTGKFVAPVLVYRRDVLGQRLMTATVPGLPAPVQSKPVLVMPLSYQPPNFVLRW